MCVTFDDAYDNFRTRALPLLEVHQVPVLLYVPVGFILGEPAADPLAGAEHLGALTVDDLRELSSHPLIRIGAHSWTHRDLRRVSATDLSRELEDARDQLEQWTGKEVEDFCYPRALWDAALESRVRDTYATATIGGGRSNDSTTDLLRLQRVSIRRGTEHLAPLLRSPLCIEEALADWFRRRRRTAQ